MEKIHPDDDHLIARLLTRRRLTGIILKLAREVERLEDDNAQLRAALEFYRKALQKFASGDNDALGKQSPVEEKRPRVASRAHRPAFDKPKSPPGPGRLPN